MATDTQTRTAVCPTHGTVEATRKMPNTRRVEHSWSFVKSLHADVRR